MLDKFISIFVAVLACSLGVFTALIVLAIIYAVLMVFIDRF